MAGHQIIFEHWGVPYGYEERFLAIQNETELSQLIHSMKPENSAVLYIEDDDGQRLSIYASEGLFSVGYQIDENTSFDLIGNTNTGQEEYIPFVQGGQLVSIPARYVVSEDLAIRVAGEFYRDGELDTTVQWDKFIPGKYWK